MEFERLSLPEVVKVTPRRIGDARGYFSEIFKEAWFRDNIADVTFVQDNQSLSARAGTLRGLHFQLDPFAQGKLVRCITGVIFDVAVDIRIGSPNYGKWIGLELSAETGDQLWIPPGFAHGFATLRPDSLVHYKVTAPYSAEHDRGLRWDDPLIAIDWPVDRATISLSEKDLHHPPLAELRPAFEYPR